SRRRHTRCYRDWSSDVCSSDLNRPAGLFHGIQTIRQLLPQDVESEMGSERTTWQIPAQNIVDYPRFAWRGAMLDVARHFFTMREIGRASCREGVEDEVGCVWWS